MMEEISGVLCCGRGMDTKCKTVYSGGLAAWPAHGISPLQAFLSSLPHSCWADCCGMHPVGWLQITQPDNHRLLPPETGPIVPSCKTGTGGSSTGSRGLFVCKFLWYLLYGNPRAVGHPEAHGTTLSLIQEGP